MYAIDTTENDTPRIYVASLADYNEGRPHGAWIDASQELEDIQAEIKAMLAASPVPGAEEYAVHDYDGFYDIRLGEYPDLERVVEVAQTLVEHGAAYAAWVANDPTYNSDLEEFQEAYVGEYANVGDYAYEIWVGEGRFEETGDWDHPSKFVDWERLGENMEMSGDIWTADAPNGVYVFNGNV